MKKKITQRIHAKKRAKERYDLELNKHDYDLIVKHIKANRVISTIKQSNTRSEKRLIYNDQIIRVIYDKKRGTVVTFLPLDDE